MTDTRLVDKLLAAIDGVPAGVAINNLIATVVFILAEYISDEERSEIISNFNADKLNELVETYKQIRDSQ